MPYTPPCCNDEHSTVMAVPYCRGENCRIEQQDESQPGVLDSNFNGQSPVILYRKFCQFASKIAGRQSESVMHKYYNADIVQILNEQLEIL